MKKIPYIDGKKWLQPIGKIEPKLLGLVLGRLNGYENKNEIFSKNFYRFLMVIVLGFNPTLYPVPFTCPQNNYFYYTCTFVINMHDFIIKLQYYMWCYKNSLLCNCHLRNWKLLIPFLIFMLSSCVVCHEIWILYVKIGIMKKIKIIFRSIVIEFI